MKLNLPRNCLVLFIDDTGNESLTDTKHPVFGLGGCAIMADHLDEVIRKPWKEVRYALKRSYEAPLHATENNKPPIEHIKVVNTFFKTQPIARFGTGCTIQTSLEDDVEVLWSVAKSLQARIIDIAKWQPFKTIVIIFEDSNQLKKLEGVFGDFGLELDDGSQIPVEKYWMKKSENEPALEVADFLANAIGAELRHRAKNKPGHAKNFEAWFIGIDERLVSFLAINSVQKKTEK